MAGNFVPLPLPSQLTNGTVADATQVMTDLNYIAQQINANITLGQVKNSAISTLTGYLSQLLVAGAGVLLTTNNPGGAETLTISAAPVAVPLNQALVQALAGVQLSPGA